MPLSDKETRKLHRACAALSPGKPGEDVKSDDYVTNLINTALDFQLKVPVLDRARAHFEQHCDIRSHAKLSALIARFPNTKSGNSLLAAELWGNNLWTRAEFLRQLVKSFEARGIKGQASLKRWFEKADFERDVKGKFKTKNHSMGMALFHWLCLRLGVDTVKPDLHVRNFVKRAIGRVPSDAEIVEALTHIARQLPKQKRKAYMLDAAIWWHQKGRDK